MTSARTVVVCGDARALPLANESVAAVITDPPYGLEFMGRQWDAFKPSSARIRRPSDRDRTPGAAHNATTFLAARGVPEAYVAGSPYQRWCQQWAAECLRVLKPGGHLLAFGGTRTWHRLVCAVEDAGFEIRDGIAWLYGSGFPKSHDVSKAIDKAAGADRVLTRPGVVIRGGLGEDWDIGNSADRPRYDVPATEDAARWQGWGTALKPAFEPIVVARKPLTGTVAANVLEHGTGALNIGACLVAHAGEADLAVSLAKNPGRADTVTSDTYGANRPQQSINTAGRWPANVALDESQAAELDRQSNPRHEGTGGVSRFFPTFHYTPKAAATERPKVDGVSHETVKPVDLMRWLVRLVTPPGGLVLDPFAGSGTTAEACVVEGFDCVAVELDGRYLPLIRARLGKPIQPVLDL